MMSRFLISIGLVLDPRFAEMPVAAPVCRAKRRTSARRAVVWALGAFVLATVGLAASLETVTPEWRDPEFGVRLHQLQRWKAEAPDRPLVVFFGSSRTQMGIAPAAMGFPDEADSPLAYNFGYRAGRPFRAWFQLMRLLDVGMRPDFVVLQLAQSELTLPDKAQLYSREWSGRMNIADLQRMSPYESDAGPLWRSWAAARVGALSDSRQAILSDLLPRWQTHAARPHQYWERLDPYGFDAQHLEQFPDDQRERLQRVARKDHSPTFAGRPIGELANRSVSDLVARCRAEGIPVALFWAPESAVYRTWYTPGARAVGEAYHRHLVDELGVTVFPAPESLPETDFCDGYHLLRGGAERYSRWLAEIHLKPWLNSVRAKR